jgi:protein-disulfide isomerase
MLLFRSLKYLVILLSTVLFMFPAGASARNLAEQIPGLFSHAGNTLIGDPSGDVTIVEFFDYRCSYCRRMPAIIDNLVKNQRHVRVVLRDYVLFGEQSELAARAALAAARQGSNVKFSRNLLNTGRLTEDNIMRIAKQSGLNIPRLKQDMQSSSISSQLEANTALADRLQINGTPAFVIGKTVPSANKDDNITVIVGAASAAQLRQAYLQAKK